MECERIFFSGHAVRRMFERGLTVPEISHVLENGEPIAEYPHDVPFASTLVLGYVGGSPLHVVVARDEHSGTCYVVTAYPPDPALWSDDFKTRRE